MMVILLYMVFVIPMIFINSFWFVFQFSMLLLMMMFININMNFFYSSIYYLFGLDFLSYGLVILSFLIICLMVISSNYIYESKYNYYFIFLNLVLGLILVLIFCSLNLLVMYLFFEASLIPILVLIFGWGYQPERLISGLYLLFYTLFASLPLLLILIFFYINYNTLTFNMLFSNSLSFILHFCMVCAFLVKLPMFMVHFWLPKAHVQAPVSGSMILAGVLLKIGGYGIIRLMFMNELSFYYYGYIWYSFSIYGSILVSFICFIQGDVKCLIAYSSIAHMGLCMMGFISMCKLGLMGSYLMMIGHGLCSSALFCLSNISYERFLSRSFFINKGLLCFMPSMSLMWFLLCCFNMSSPPSVNFISEIMIMMSMIMYWKYSFVFLIFLSFMSACFSFFLFSYTQHGSFHSFYCYSLGNIKEYLMIVIHIIPLFLILLVMDCFFF
uniref:NADH-ubiquinone oxidoreductase chain 4 n=1 Tax=Mileewa sharpa TaxID=2984023 RepID=A0A977TM24_9HEMI|nr:NADH dehydrogenase subunit 4 [Mileewa sharpa]UXX17561.1 NADH dehydrogenase subunit 4 [Mileewa sharpa]